MGKFAKRLTLLFALLAAIASCLLLMSQDALRPMRIGSHVRSEYFDPTGGPVAFNVRREVELASGTMADVADKVQIRLGSTWKRWSPTRLYIQGEEGEAKRIMFSRTVGRKDESVNVTELANGTLLLSEDRAASTFESLLYVARRAR